jgi:hypothetical protein
MTFNLLPLKYGWAYELVGCVNSVPRRGRVRRPYGRASVPLIPRTGFLFRVVSLRLRSEGFKELEIVVLRREPVTISTLLSRRPIGREYVSAPSLYRPTLLPSAQSAVASFCRDSWS